MNFSQVFVGMQIAYILWTLLVEGRPRPTIAALFMFASRGILGTATQLPLPQVPKKAGTYDVFSCPSPQFSF